jgi:hypothetical protein
MDKVWVVTMGNGNVMAFSDRETAHETLVMTYTKAGPVLRSAGITKDVYSVRTFLEDGHIDVEIGRGEWVSFMTKADHL